MGQEIVSTVNLTRAKLQNIWLLGVSGSVNVKGYFVDGEGNRTGASFDSADTADVPVGNGTNNPLSFEDLAGEIPDDAVSARVVLDGNVYWDVWPGGAFSTDFEENYANYPEMIADPEYNIFGRGEE